MTKILAVITLLIVTAGSAFGATADFVFFNKLGLLILANVVLGGLLAFCAFVIASHLWDKLTGNKFRPARVRARQQTRKPNRHFRSGPPGRGEKVING